jgi:hypothetical protein
MCLLPPPAHDAQMYGRVQTRVPRVFMRTRCFPRTFDRRGVPPPPPPLRSLRACVTQVHPHRAALDGQLATLRHALEANTQR